MKRGGEWPHRWDTASPKSLIARALSPIPACPQWLGPQGAVDHGRHAAIAATPGTSCAYTAWLNTGSIAAVRPRLLGVYSPHGVGVREAQHELPIVFVRRLTHHQVLRCRIDIPQTPLEHTRGVQGRPAAVAKRLRRDLY